MEARRTTGNRARMIDVAKRADVALVTVSRVLNGSDSVKPETRRRVWAVIEEIGYVPNLIAGSLVTNRTGIIAVIVPTIGNPVFSETVEAMADELRDSGYHILLGSSREDGSDEFDLVSKFLSRRPDGMFIHGGKMTPNIRKLIKTAGIPFVQSGDLDENKEPVDMVVAFSNFDAAKAMTEHLIDRSYRKIGFVGRQFDQNDRSSARLKGYLAALRDRDIPTDENIILERDLGFAEGAESLLTLRQLAPDLDAVFFAGDVWAAGALYECTRQGWRVPNDIAIAGFDDHAIAAQTVPRLTTVRVRRSDIGRHAATLLLQRIAGKEPNRATIDVGFQIICRQTS